MQGVEEVLEECRVGFDQRFGVGPGCRAGVGCWLEVAVEEDVVGVFQALVGERLGDFPGGLEKIACDMFDTRLGFGGDQGHHLGWRWSSRKRVYLLPALGSLEQDTHGVEAGDAVGAGDDRGKAFDILGVAREIVVYAPSLHTIGCHLGDDR